MKKFILAIAVVIAIASIANAELLMTANTIGAGKWGGITSFRYDMVSTANSNMYGLEGFARYGLMDKMDIYVGTGYGINSNPVAGVTANAITLALAAKYQFLAEDAKSMPVSVAGLVKYQPTTMNWTFGAFSGQVVTRDIGIGAIVSKVMSPWIPYGALVYHSLTVNPGASNGSNIEIVAGGQYQLSKSSTIIGEISYNSTSIAGASSTTNQISIGYSQNY